MMSLYSCSSFSSIFLSQYLVPYHQKIQNNYFKVVRNTKPMLVAPHQMWIHDKFNFKLHFDAQRQRDVIISKAGDDPSDGLELVDAIRRLGIDYVFEGEIERILQKQYKLFNDRNRTIDHSLREVSLRFRLLRQQGYSVPADIFCNFKDSKGNFKEKLSEDIEGLIELYEASHVRIAGEFILDEAEEFSGHVLNSWLSMRNDDHRSRIVMNTLKHPSHKSLVKFTPKTLFFDRTSRNPNNGWLNSLQELAQLESNRRQSMHKTEIDQVLKWWREIGLGKELKFARDQPVKWHNWSMACLEDPKLTQHRVELTKSISFIYIIDDIFDIIGTLHDLTLFTEAIKRWDIDSIQDLPDYMKICFKALYSFTNEMGRQVYHNHGCDPVHYLRRTWSSLCEAFLVEAKWFDNGHVPGTEEYFRNGVVSSGVHVVLVHVFFLLGHGINKEETLNFVVNMPAIITSTAAILRLSDDLGSAKDENQEGHDGSYIECYMKERQGVSIEEAREHISEKFSDSWKCLNKECLIISQNSLLSTLAKASLNLARLVPLMYSYDDDSNAFLF